MGKRKTPILDKVRRLMGISTPLAKTSKSGKKLKLLRRSYDSYGFIQEYQFSPSHKKAPLFHITRRKNRDLCSVLEVVFVWLKGGFGRQEIGEKEYYFYRNGKNSAMEGFNLPAIEHSMEEEEVDIVDDDEDEDGYSSSLSVDERAERFIDRFYQQMRTQRIHSTLLLCD